MIEASRIRLLKDRPPRPGGDYVLYWMQQAPRAAHNPALEYAIEEANDLGLPVLCAFALTAYPEATARAYAFLLQGLADTDKALAARDIGFCVRHGAWDSVIVGLAENAALVVCDRGYLRLQRQWREGLVEALDRRIVQVETDAVVPIESASPKHEYAARTLRPKLHRLWDDYLVELRPRKVKRPARALPEGDVDLTDLDAALRKLKLNHDVPPVRRFTGGHAEARRRLDDFVDSHLKRYDQDRNFPEKSAVSHLSPYLHFGQISPVEIAQAARQGPAGDGRTAFVEELIVRRELAFNHVFYEPNYDRYDSLPGWARETLAKASHNPAPHRYSAAQLEAGETHDRYWNAAMKEMTATGYMHNRLRMYWGKKVLEWSSSPEHAFETLLALNNKYFLDGRDANSFTNVGWIFGLHDRPWGPQPRFGTVRSMGPNTFKKFDAEAYVREVDRLAAAEAD